jgi:hypothetical protein
MSYHQGNKVIAALRAAEWEAGHGGALLEGEKMRWDARQNTDEARSLEFQIQWGKVTSAMNTMYRGLDFPREAEEVPAELIPTLQGVIDTLEELQDPNMAHVLNRLNEAVRILRAAAE